jgi:hypothetical protein
MTLLASAKSRITISFDGWKSDNEVDLLAIMAHLLDANFKPKVILLSLRNTYGSHAGEEIKQQLYDVLTEYRILDRIAFFMADNATSNDKALKLLAEVNDINPIKQRLSCTGHVLAAPATLSTSFVKLSSTASTWAVLQTYSWTPSTISNTAMTLMLA